MEDKPAIFIDYRGESGNVFFVMALAIDALNKSNMREIAKKLPKEVENNAKNYKEALEIMRKYVDIYDVAGEV